MKNIELNKTYSTMIYFVISFLLIAVFLFFSFPVFADVDSSFSSSDCTIAFSSSSPVRSPRLSLISSSPSSFAVLPPYFDGCTFSDGLYAYDFAAPQSLFSYSGTSYCCAVFDGTYYYSLILSDSSSQYYYIWDGNYPSGVDSAATFSSLYDVYYSGPYRNSSGPRNIQPGIPVYDSLDSALSSFSSFISSPGSASLISTSYQPVSSTSYIKSTKSGCSGYAFYFDGTYYNLVVGNINSTAFVNIATDTSQHPINLPSQLTFDDTPIYYNPNAMRVSEADTSEFGYFTNLNQAVEAIYDVLDVSTSEPSQNLAHPLNLALQPGNVAFIDITGLSEQYFSIKCNLSGLAYYTLADFNSKMNYMIGYADSLPASFSLPISGTSKIDWTVERGVKPTVTGTYNQFYYSDLYSFSSGKYLVVVNPVYENIDINSVTVMDINAYNVNNILNISMEANDYYVYSLSVSVGYQDGQSTYETGSSMTQYAGTYDSSTESWQTVNTATNEPESPSYGGDVQQPTYTPEQESKRFVTWLQDFLKGFVSIFDAGKTAIMTLVGYAGSFFSVIGSLYAWLPPPVYSVLISGIILVITIGIIKAFI